MKKILSLVMALLLLALCPAIAETVETSAEMQTLVSPDGSYLMEVPADYFALNSESVEKLFATEEMQQNLCMMLGLQDISEVEMYIAMLVQSNFMLVYSGDMMSNFNVQSNETGLTVEMLMMWKEQMDSDLTQMYVAMGVAEQDVQLMDIQKIGGRSWYAITAALGGVNQLMAMTAENGVHYTFTFTGVDAEMIRHVLETFVVVPTAE